MKSEVRARVDIIVNTNLTVGCELFIIIYIVVR